MTVYEIVRVHAHGGQLVTTRVGDRTYTTEEVVDAVTELTGNVPGSTNPKRGIRSSSRHRA
jgi:hypothetical protein